MDTSVGEEAVMLEGRKERRAEDNDGGVKEDAAVRACVRKDAMAKRICMSKAVRAGSIYNTLSEPYCILATKRRTTSTTKTENDV